MISSIQKSFELDCACHGLKRLKLWTKVSQWRVVRENPGRRSFLIQVYIQTNNRYSIAFGSRYCSRFRVPQSSVLQHQSLTRGRASKVFQTADQKTSATLKEFQGGFESGEHGDLVLKMMWGVSFEARRTFWLLFLFTIQCHPLTRIIVWWEEMEISKKFSPEVWDVGFPRWKYEQAVPSAFPDSGLSRKFT